MWSFSPLSPSPRTSHHAGRELKVQPVFLYQTIDVEEELKAREGDQRVTLMRLYDHPNPQVRLQAIKAALAVAPKRARRKLEMLARSNEYPQSGAAGMSIVNLDRGIFKPM